MGGELETEGSTFSGGAFGPDVSTQIVDDLSADGQTQPSAARFGATSGTLMEFLEDALEILWRDAGPIVGDTDTPSARHQTQRDAYLARAGR